jgi:thiamine-phosphate pyrophosphorylase
MLIGRSTHSLEQAKAAAQEGFDYLGFGPLFPTPTKLGRPGIGLENVKFVQQQVGEKIPLFCIGGITPNNLTEVLRAGAKRVVIVSAILRAPDIATAIREVKAQLDAQVENALDAF